MSELSRDRELPLTGLEHLKYIAIDGPIGVGATSLANALVERLNAMPMMEPVDSITTLRRFYENPTSIALHTQLSFLMARIKQQREIRQLISEGQTVVSDYLFAKDNLFARVNLTTEEMILYNDLLGELSPAVPTPDIVVYLQGNIDTLVSRVHKRGAQHEDEINREYLTKIIDAYNHYFFHSIDAPLLMVNTDEIDFVNHSEDLESLMEQIAKTGSGTRYFVSTGTAEE